MPGSIVDAGLVAAGSAAPTTSILIVDDVPENHVVYRAVLADLGQNLVSAYSGAEALRQVIKRDKRFKNGHAAGGTTPPRRPAGV